MRAIVLRQPMPVTERPLAMLDVPDPQPAAGDVLARVNACGGCRTDLHVVEGDLPVRRSPVIPGQQVVGRVIFAGTRFPSRSQTKRDSHSAFCRNGFPPSGGARTFRRAGTRASGFTYALQPRGPAKHDACPARTVGRAQSPS